MLSRLCEYPSKVLPHLGRLPAGGRVGHSQTGSEGVQEVAPGEVVLQSKTSQQNLSNIIRKMSPVLNINLEPRDCCEDVARPDDTKLKQVDEVKTKIPKNKSLTSKERRTSD